MDNWNEPVARLAIPSKGGLEGPTLDFLAASGLKVVRPNPRQYTASVPSVPALAVLFQRAADIYSKVEEGSVDLGITGYDIVAEQAPGRGDVVMLRDRLGFGACQLVLAVPQSWVDVSSIDDLADLSVRFKEKGNEIRIATKYTTLTRKWLYERGIMHFSLIEAQGALEVAPSMGYTDLIADITSSGTTLRENRLKQIEGGTIVASQACLIGNRRLLAEQPHKLAVARVMLELIEARLRATSFITVSAALRAPSPDAIARLLAREPALSGAGRPILTRAERGDGCGDWYAITVRVPSRQMLDLVDALRREGAVEIAVTSPQYLFEATSSTVERLQATLRAKR